MTDPDSPRIDFTPEKFDLDMNGKRFTEGGGAMIRGSTHQHHEHRHRETRGLDGTRAPREDRVAEHHQPGDHL